MKKIKMVKRPTSKQDKKKNGYCRQSNKDLKKRLCKTMNAR